MSRLIKKDVGHSNPFPKTPIFLSLSKYSIPNLSLLYIRVELSKKDRQMLSFFLGSPVKQIIIITVIPIIVMAVFPLDIETAIQQVNTQNTMKENTSGSVRNHSIALTNNTRVVINATQNRTAEIEIAPNMSATFVLNNQTSINLNPLYKNTTSQCCQPCQPCQPNNRELSDKLENIRDSINQLRTSFDNSTLPSIIGLGSGLVAIALSILLPYYYESAKRPKLVVETAESSENENMKYLHGKVVNMPHGRRSFAHLFGIERNPAINTKVTMGFFKDDGKKSPIPSLPKKIPAKWGSAPEPLTHDRSDFDSTKLALLYRETITSDHEGEAFIVVVKHRGDKECYVVTGDNYRLTLLPSGVKHILKDGIFKIEESKILVEILVTSGNYSKTATFLITNGPDFDHFTMSLR